MITGHFPKIDISSAVSAVKMDNQRNKYLQHCRFPKYVGGCVDAWIGIQYNTCQPQLIHMMPSGLAIYEMPLMPHSKNIKYVLGGPHSSFDFLLTRIPDANLLMSKFTEGLAQWRSSGPPSLTQYVMSEQEVDLAIMRNLSMEEMDNYKELLKVEDQEAREISACAVSQGDVVQSVVQADLPAEVVRMGQADLPAEVVKMAQSNLPAEAVKVSSSYLPPKLVNLDRIQDLDREEYSDIDHNSDTSRSHLFRESGLDNCADCGCLVTEEYIAALEHEKLSHLKNLVDLQEAGLDISYRCVRCRNCLDCKNAEKVDKINLREEAED